MKIGQRVYYIHDSVITSGKIENIFSNRYQIKPDIESYPNTITLYKIQIHISINKLIEFLKMNYNLTKKSLKNEFT